MMNNSIINNKELLKLQKKYRTGLIKEEDLSNEELEQLKELYKQQIEYVENLIEEKKKEILALKNSMKNS